MFAKNEFFVLFVIAGIFLMSFAYAIPNPAPVYCEEMGYTVEGEDCVFDDGERCAQWAFYNGDCGREYVKDLSCTESGEPNLPGHECCSGLVPIQPAVLGENGSCGFRTGWSICAPCGNGICDVDLENKCNCPEDCGEVEECYGEGESLPVLPGPSEVCCEGLKLIPPKCDPNGLEACPVGTAGICTAKCGNGECDTRLESAYNCPVDCGEQECAENGEKVYYRTEFGPTYCCSKNAGIKPSSFLNPESGQCIALPDGSKGTCVDSWWRTCGDGKCSGGEDKCNCQKDCEQGCICPLIYAPVCGVDGRTYSNKCVAACENVEVAYEGECRSHSIRVEIGEKFELNEKQTALLLENGTSTGVEITLVDIQRATYRADYDSTEEARPEEIPPYSALTARLQVTKTEGDTASSTWINTQEGGSAEVFGIIFSALEITESQIVLLTEKESRPDYIRVKLNERFSLVENQTAYVMKGNEDVMKINFDGVISSGTCTAKERARTYTEDEMASGKVSSCWVAEYAQLHVSFASGGQSYVRLRPGQTENIGNNYEISVFSLNQTSSGKYTVNLVVRDKTVQETVIAYLGQPFNLQQGQKAIVKETRLQLRLVDIGNDVALVEVWGPITPSTSSGGGAGEPVSSPAVARTAARDSVPGYQGPSNAADQPVLVSSTERAQIVETAEIRIREEKALHTPYIKIRVGQTQKVYGHEITLNEILYPDCGEEVDCVGASDLANFTVTKETGPGTKTVYLNQKFDLDVQQTAIVLDSTRGGIRSENLVDHSEDYVPRYEAMRINLLGIAYPTCTAAEVGTSESGEEKLCSARPIAKLSIESEMFNGMLTLREGEERAVGGYTVRLLDISGNKAVFIVRKAISDVIKVRLDEKFRLSKAQTALVVEEGLYIKLEGIQLVRCAEEDARCIGGSYATVSVWKNRANSTIGLHKVRVGNTLKLYGLRITLLDLDSGKATFVVRKGASNIINVHVNEPFKLEESQAARVLEANMRIDLLSIVSPICGIDEDCRGGKIVEISVSNYLFSKELTGKKLVESDYLETVVEEEATEVLTEAMSESGSISVSSGVSESIGMPVPPKPFNVYRLVEGESVTVNDFVITVLGIGYNSAEFVVKKRGSNIEMKLELHNGWNLFSIPGDLDVISSSECDSSNLKLFEYIPKKNTFVEVETPEKGKAYWLYNPGKTCSVKAIVREAVSMSEIDPLVVGWNFVPVTVDMIGSKMRDIGAQCDLKAAYFYNAAGRNWQNAMDRTISASDLGKAFAVYANKACSFGLVSSPVGPLVPPTLPGLEG